MRLLPGLTSVRSLLHRGSFCGHHDGVVVDIQAVLDNLAAENALDCALAAAHLFTACSDASLLTKQHRLAVLCAATLREAREGPCGDDALAAAAVTAAVKHLHAVHASADAAGGGSGVANGAITSMVCLAARHSNIFFQEHTALAKTQHIVSAVSGLLPAQFGWCTNGGILYTTES